MSNSNWIRNGLDLIESNDIDGDQNSIGRILERTESAPTPTQSNPNSFNFLFDPTLFLSNQSSSTSSTNSSGNSTIPRPSPREPINLPLDLVAPFPIPSPSASSSIRYGNYTYGSRQAPGAIWNRTVAEEEVARQRSQFRNQSSSLGSLNLPSTSFIDGSDLSSTSSIFLPPTWIPPGPTPSLYDNNSQHDSLPLSPRLDQFPDAHTSLIGPSTSTQSFNSSPDNSPPLNPLPRRKRGPEVIRSLPSGLPSIPAHSPWAMWCGNIPTDATREELWKFFTGREESLQNSGLNSGNGVESIHLIQRSNCAFINYFSSAALNHAIATKHGNSLRPTDRRSKNLVCRVRMREDDVKSGVGAQRGGGMHKNYIKENAVVSGKSEEEDGSSGSTSESLLEREFPKRYFILKSHNEQDLRESTRTGTWCTQSHNEVVLDKAFRTSKEGVYLIFSANKSGEWYGYAKMTSAIKPVPIDPNSSPVLNQDNLDIVGMENVTLSASNEVGEIDQSIGHPFKIDWIKVQRLPFLRTKNILNSFNSNREVKISRDGTEIEPKAGEFLLKEFWNSTKRGQPMEGRRRETIGS